MTPSARQISVAAAVAANAMVLAAVWLGRGTLLLLLVVLAAAGVVLAARPQRALLVLAALVPFDGLLVLVDLPDIVAGWKEALIVIALLATAVAPAGARRAPGRPLPGWVPGAVALVALGLASAAVVGGTQGLVGAKIWFFYLVTVPLVAWRCPLSARERDHLVTILVATGFVTSAYGLLQQVLGHERLSQMGYPYNATIRFAGGFLRSFSTFVQPFPFGFFMMLVILIGLAHALAEPQRLRSRVFLLGSPLLALGLLSSVVRGAWLGVAVGLAVLGVRRHRGFALALPLALVALPFLPADVGAAGFSSSSSQERIASWSERGGQILERPLGSGIGASGAAAERAAELAGLDAEIFQPDNHYFKAALELGIPGLWLFVLLLAAVLGATLAAERRGPPELQPLALGTAAFVAGSIAASTVATYFEIFPIDLYFWLLVAVVTMDAAAARTAGRRQVRQGRRSESPWMSAGGSAPRRSMMVGGTSNAER